MRCHVTKLEVEHHNEIYIRQTIIIMAIISPTLLPWHAHKVYSVVFWAWAITIIGICGHNFESSRQKRYNGRWWLQNQLDRFTTSGRGALAGLVDGSEEDSLGIYLQTQQQLGHRGEETSCTLFQLSVCSAPTVQLSSFHFLSVWFYVVGLLLSHSLSICGWLWGRTQSDNFEGYTSFDDNNFRSCRGVYFMVSVTRAGKHPEEHSQDRCWNCC